MECAQNDDAQALVHTCAQNRCEQESLLLSLLPSSALFSLQLFYISLGIFWPLLVQCWFHAGSLYQLVESGPAGSFRYMRASLLKSGKIEKSGWYGRNSMKLRPNFWLYILPLVLQAAEAQHRRLMAWHAVNWRLTAWCRPPDTLHDQDWLGVSKYVAKIAKLAMNKKNALGLFFE